jgi:hypothetical protein
MTGSELLKAAYSRYHSWACASEFMYREFMLYFGKTLSDRWGSTHIASREVAEEFIADCTSLLQHLGREIDNTDPENTRTDLNYLAETILEQVKALGRGMKLFELDIPVPEIPHKDPQAVR